MSSSRDLLLRLEQAFSSPDATDLASLQQVLQAAKPDFINLLRYQGPNAESRSQVQSRAPMTPAGQVVLDEEPDVREVLLLSDELKLDEILALLCILTVRDELDEVSAAAAAGLYFEERRALLCSLWMLLQAQVLGADGMPPGMQQLVSVYNEELLSLERQGHTMLVERLVELVRDNQLEAGPGSRLPLVMDIHGREVERNVLVQREQALLCECLVYACCIRRRLTSADISGLVDLTHHLAFKVKAAGPGELSLQQQGYLVLLATMLTMAPLQEAGEPGDAEADAQALDALARSTALDGKVCGLDPASPYCAALKLAWGVLLAQHGPESALERAAEQVNAALGAGVFGFLRTDVVESVPMQDDADHQQELYATILNQMLMAFLDSPVGRDAVESLTAASASLGQQEVAATATASTPASQAAAGALVLADTNAGTASAAAAKPDNLASLLSLLAGVLRLYPDLFLDESQRYAVLGAFMGHLAGQQALVQAPSVFVAYMDVLTALATGEKGARSMYQQLRPDNSVEVLTWRRMFSVLVQYIRMYNPPDQLEGAGAGGAAGAGSTGVVPQRTADFVLPACDSLALCAYLRLFSRVMREGQADEVASWVSQLEEDAGVAPIWEVLVQLMCCPVPQELKAALDEALASLARRPDLSSLLLERLVAAVVVQPGAAAGQASVPRYDITYQLNEIEGRSEEYSEAIAFVRLLNALWRGSGDALPNEGRGLAHLTKFVKDDVLATVFQRTYKEERQCWEVAAACLEHCRLCIEGFNPSVAGDTTSTAKPPGFEVLTDVLGERAVLRACMRILLAPVEQLAAERNGAPYGAAKEAAALAALRLLCAVLEVDAEFVAAVRRATLTGTYEPLDGVLRHDRSRIPALLDYVRYPHNPALQVTALRLAAHLAERVPDLVHLLPDDVRLVGGFAACLQDALFNTDTTWAEEEAGALAAANSGDEGGVGDGEDPRAMLILTLLLGTLDQPAPNLTHLLAGFNYDAGMNFVGPAPSQYNVLRVVLEALGSPTLPTQHPHMYEQCLELVHDLAAASDTGPAMLDMLRSRWAGLSVLLDTLALAPLPEAAAARAASLNSRAWLLKLLALELHHADLALAHHAQVAQGLLEALFAPSEAGDPGSSSGQSRMQQLLQLVTSFGPLDKPQLGRDAPPEVRRMLQSLDADSLFAGEAGTSIISPRGYVLYDVRAVKNSLLQRYNDWVSRHGPPNDALKEACRLCLAFAQESNMFVDEVAGQTSLTASWCAVTTIAFSRRLDALVAACGGAPSVELCLEGAEDCLVAAGQLVADGKDTLAAPLCDVLGVLLACLQERLGAAAAPRPLVETIPPPRCLELLEALLAAAWDGRRSEAVRLPLYTSLGTYLALTSQAEAPAGPPAVLEALLQQGDGRQAGNGASSAAQLDELQSQLEEGVGGLLQAHSRVLGLLAADAQSPNMAQAAVALTTLVAVVGSDASGALAQELHALGLPTVILQGLSNTPASLLSERSSGVGARLQVVQLQLSLLNRLCLAGHTPTDGPQKLFMAQALVRLSGCQLLDAQPEDPYTYTVSGTVSQRRRLGGILVAALRLALGVLRPLSHSAAVREQALGLVEARARTWVRLLHEASHLGTRDWSPGSQEVEQAELALQLLAEVLPEAAELAAWPQLHEAFSRLAARYLWPAPTSQLFLPGPVGLDGADSSMDEEGPAAAAADLRARARVLGLRCALALCVYRGGLQASLFPYAADPSTAHPFMFIKNALALVVHQDMPFLLDLGTGLVPFNSREAGGQGGVGPDLDVLQEVLLYRTSHLAELLVSTYFELLRAQPQNEGQLPELEGKRCEEVRGVFGALEQLLQGGSLLVKYADTLPLLLRRTLGLLQ